MLYGVRFGYSRCFFEQAGLILGKFTDFILGKFNDEAFSCHSKSGSQNLWLPFKAQSGLKLFHPTRYSGTPDKAMAHQKAQSLLATTGFAPKPLAMHEVEVSFVESGVEHPFGTCYGLMMERVVCGSLNQVLTNLASFGVESNRRVRVVVKSFINWYGGDALTLRDYIVLSRFFHVSDNERLNEIINGLDTNIPSIFRGAPDLLTPSNVVLDPNGNPKVIDFDLSGI